MRGPMYARLTHVYSAKEYTAMSGTECTMCVAFIIVGEHKEAITIFQEHVHEVCALAIKICNALNEGEKA